MPSDGYNKKLKKDSKETTSQIEKDFNRLGDSIESRLVDSLDVIGGKFTDAGHAKRYSSGDGKHHHKYSNTRCP